MAAMSTINVDCPICDKPLPPVPVATTSCGTVGKGSSKLEIEVHPEFDTKWRMDFLDQHPHCGALTK